MRRTTISALLSLSTLAALSVPAQAEPNRHCVVSLADNTTKCHNSFQAAISAATGGRVTLTANTPAAAAADPAFASALDRAAGTMAAQASTVIGIEYSSDDYEGSSLIYSAPWGCDGDKDVAYPDWWVNELPAWWNDEIESFRTYAGCAALHFWDSYRNGSWLGYWYSWGDLHWMNNEASSIAWS
ncbi:MAG TPA: hypothetical protein VM677_24200 [Actinokineospora sp.]|jgi:hypothetical protein|nr:hypothetical protein [Actinokineospora sp.]